jgi:hemoglobin
MSDAVTVFEAAGGVAAFERLVGRFYAAVANDPLLRPMYPDDLDESRRRLTFFLIQYFGGPQTYSTERGHPRLRMRHFPFAVDLAARDAWMAHMNAALDAAEIPELPREEIRSYLEGAATFLINRPS